MDRAYINRVVKNLRDYGYHRNELFMTRAMAKEAADLIEELDARREYGS